MTTPSGPEPSSSLRRCPFCGMTATTGVRSATSYYARCMNLWQCGASIAVEVPEEYPDGFSAENVGSWCVLEAARRWNQRDRD